MTRSTEDRLVKARDRVWLGEVAGLDESLTHLRQRQWEAQTQKQPETVGIARRNGYPRSAAAVDSRRPLPKAPAVRK